MSEIVIDKYNPGGRESDDGTEASQCDVPDSVPSRLRRRRKTVGCWLLRQFPSCALTFDGRVGIPSCAKGAELAIAAKSGLGSEARRNAVTDMVTTYDGDARVQSIVDYFRTGEGVGFKPELKDAVADTVRSFLPLDYKTEQLPLFWNIEHGLDIYESLGGDLTALSEGQEDAIIKLVASRQVLNLTNMRLVLNKANKYKFMDNSVPYADILQEGNIGLLRAISLFDASKGLEFSTYACTAIESRILIAIAEQSRNIKLSADQDRVYQKIRKTRGRIEDLLNREASASEIATEMGISEGEVALLTNVGCPQYLSIDTPLGDDKGSATIADLAEDVYGGVPVDRIADIDAVSRIIRQTSLEPRAKFILGIRYRLDLDSYGDQILSGGDLSYAEYRDAYESVEVSPRNDLATHVSIAGICGGNRKQVRLAEKDALEVLRNEARISGIDKFFTDSTVQNTTT